MCKIGTWWAVLALDFFVYHVMGSIEIMDLQVPSSVDGSSEDPVILDCIYNVENETGLEVKWFFNEDLQISSWIPGVTKLQGIGRFAPLLDTDYEATQDPGSIYRALYIKEITPDMTGNYTCKVSSYFHEDVQTKEMVVYESAKEFELIHEVLSDTVICSANGLYPEPIMMLSVKYATDSNDSVPVLDSEEDLAKDENGTYSFVSIIRYDYLEEPVEFICNLSIPETDYQKGKTLIYYPAVKKIVKVTTDTGIPTSLPSCWLILGTALVLAFSQTYR